MWSDRRKYRHLQFTLPAGKLAGGGSYARPRVLANLFTAASGMGQDFFSLMKTFYHTMAEHNRHPMS